MDRSDVIDMMKQGTCIVEFKKVNGEYRKMQCTLDEQRVPVRGEPSRVKKPNDDVQAVFDVLKEDWRSFRWDKLETVNGVVFDGA